MNSRVDSTVLAEGWHADTYIQAENTISIVSDRSFDEVCARLEHELAQAGMAVSHVNAFGPSDGRSAESGEAVLRFNVRVFDVSDPLYAARLITLDADLACLVPHRVAVHDRDGVVTVVTPRPTSLVGDHSNSARAARIAQSTESTLRRVIRAVM